MEEEVDTAPACTRSEPFPGDVSSAGGQFVAETDWFAFVAAASRL